MKRSLLIASGLMVASGAFAQVINFHAASQGYAFYGGYNVLYYGQGAASDPGNNVWNGFGQYGGPGSTDFMGAAILTQHTALCQAGFPAIPMLGIAEHLPLVQPCLVPPTLVLAMSAMQLLPARSAQLPLASITASITVIPLELRKGLLHGS